MVCITVPNRGYALAKAASIVVRVPESAEIGTKGSITVLAVAEWLGQTGAVAIKQARDFNFSVEVISEKAGGEEKIIEEHGTTKPAKPPSIIGRWLPAIIAAAVAVLAAVLIRRLVRRRRE
jgi:flagellar biosynthesis/type III secretory pathway M-ring protein FliF/YscJ